MKITGFLAASAGLMMPASALAIQSEYNCQDACTQQYNNDLQHCQQQYEALAAWSGYGAAWERENCEAEANLNYQNCQEYCSAN